MRGLALAILKAKKYNLKYFLQTFFKYQDGNNTKRVVEFIKKL